MTSNKLIRCARALDCLKQLWELYDEEEERHDQTFLVNSFSKKREEHTLEAHLLKDILWESDEEFQNFSVMSIDKFEELISLVGSSIERETALRPPLISARLRLAITLRYIATGDSFRSLECLVPFSRKTISTFIPKVLQAIIEALHGQYFKTPSTEMEWNEVANGFESLWQFPHTLGAIDGKHIRVKAPPHSGSDKQFFNIVLLTVVDAHSRFIYVEVGENEKAPDYMIYKNSALCKALKTGKLNLPLDKPLKGQSTKTPFFFISDDVFGLCPNLMNTYNRRLGLTASQEAFNYRLSRARMTAEMAFGRLVARFRIFNRPLEVSVNTRHLLVKACCTLHNYVSRTRVKPPMPEKEHFHKCLPDTLSALPNQKQCTYKHEWQMRENFRRYCVTDGDVPDQWVVLKKKKITK